jgi:hypothetical protein
VQDLALLHELRHRADGLLDLDVRVDAVLVVEVDVVGFESLKRALDGAVDMLGRTVERAERRHVAGRRPVGAARELGRDHVLVAAPLDRAADKLLVCHRPVQLRRVEEVAAEIERALDRGRRLLLVGGPVERRHPHAAQSDRRDLRSVRSEGALVHFAYSLFGGVQLVGLVRY